MYELEPATLGQRRDELLEMMELTEPKRLTAEFSHGMKKKLALAAALLPSPELLFLDEPFEGVDAVASAMLREPLRRAVERGVTIFLTSHVLEIVEKLCTDVGILAHGRLVHQGTMEELHKDGSSLEEKFLAVVGNDGHAAQDLSWLQSPKGRA
jgi:ABC-2 type transport system ATP-binding protein